MKWGEKTAKEILDQSHPRASLWKRLRSYSSQLGVSVSRAAPSFPSVTHQARCEVYNLPAVHLDLHSLDESSRDPYSHSSLHSVTRRVALPPLPPSFILKDAVQRSVQVLPSGRCFTQTFPHWPSLFGALFSQRKKRKNKAEFRTMMEGCWPNDRGCSAIFWSCREVKLLIGLFL